MPRRSSGAAQEMSHEQVRTAHVRVLCLEAGAGSRETGSSGSGSRAGSGEQDGRLEPRSWYRTKCDRTDSDLLTARAPCSLLPAPRPALGNQRRYRPWD